MANFRAIKGAVSLKQIERGGIIDIRQHFRAIKGAVSLKQKQTRCLLAAAKQFPRHQRRGLIEANKTPGYHAAV